MSEYKCQEPGCHFHIGIAGALVTDEDFEQQAYYDQEVEDHYQTHEAKKHQRDADPFRSLLLQRDKVCRLCGGEFPLDRRSKWSPTIMRLHPTLVGAMWLVLVHRPCEIDQASLDGHPAVKRLRAENLELQLGGSVSMGRKKAPTRPKGGTGWVKTSDQPLSAGLDREVTSIKLDASVPGNVLLQHVNGRVEISVAGVGVREHHVRIRRDDQGSLCITSDFLTNGRNEHGLALDGEPMPHDALNGRHGQVVQNLNVFSSEVTDDHFSGHKTSLSVDTPNGAVGGTPESTERDQHPARAGRKKPSAAATAEGNETNTHPAKGIERN
ncbi:hypothetical protein [Glutamicibacter creatinolyticus]|uniref:hypothetical protein n=1 Tax=Glutamicibacter creatinolyticus TaxID=162496 RepID=UPI00321648AB